MVRVQRRVFLSEILRRKGKTRSNRDEQPRTDRRRRQDNDRALDDERDNPAHNPAPGDRQRHPGFGTDGQNIVSYQGDGQESYQEYTQPVQEKKGHRPRNAAYEKSDAHGHEVSIREQADERRSHGPRNEKPCQPDNELEGSVAQETVDRSDSDERCRGGIDLAGPQFVEP